MRSRNLSVRNNKSALVERVMAKIVTVVKKVLNEGEIWHDMAKTIDVPLSKRNIEEIFDFINDVKDVRHIVANKANKDKICAKLKGEVWDWEYDDNGRIIWLAVDYGTILGYISGVDDPQGLCRPEKYIRYYGANLEEVEACGDCGDYDISLFIKNAF